MFYLLCLMRPLKEVSINVSTYIKTLTHKRHLKCFTRKKRVGQFKVSFWETELKCKETDAHHKIGIQYWEEGWLFQEECIIKELNLNMHVRTIH